MNETLLESLTLHNALTLEFWDLSRVLAGDRWLVTLEARMDVPLEPEGLDAHDDREAALSLLRARYGPTLPYRKRVEKHFVDHNHRETLLREFLQRLKADLVPYLSSPKFPGRLTRHRLERLRKEQPGAHL